MEAYEAKRNHSSGPDLDWPICAVCWQLPACAQAIGYTLLTVFTNPTPVTGDYFGSSVVAVGADRVLIAAPWDNTGATWAGAAYLFSLNGALLTTFTNPTPAAND